MFNSSVLDVVIGVIVGFLAVSLVTSAIVEAINSALKLRSSNLQGGIQALVNDPNMQGLARQLYEHAAINPRGSAVSAAGAVSAPFKNRPAYIDKQQFAMALLDLTGISAASTGQGAQSPGAGAVSALLAAIDTSLPGETNPQIKQLLVGIVQRAQGDVKLVQKNVADWFDNAMDRVGGGFKRWTQLASVLVALGVAIVLNVNTLVLGERLWEQPTLAANLNPPASVGVTGPAGAATLQQHEQAAVAAIAFIDTSLPVGWPDGQVFRVDTGGGRFAFWWTSGSGWALFPGWLVTAVAALFGAPFWFDALQTVVRLKGAGPSPRDKVDGRAASE
jgi:hypothetical protein